MWIASHSASPAVICTVVVALAVIAATSSSSYSFSFSPSSSASRSSPASTSSNPEPRNLAFGGRSWRVRSYFRRRRNRKHLGAVDQQFAYERDQTEKVLNRADRKSNFDRNQHELDRLSTIAASTNCMAQYEPLEDCARRETTGSKNPFSLFGSA